jgi:hypothetical protein
LGAGDLRLTTGDDLRLDGDLCFVKDERVIYFYFLFFIFYF